MALAGLASTAQATPHGGASPASRVRLAVATGAHAGSPSGTGASNVSNLGSAGWEVQSSAVATRSGAQISTPGFSTGGWLPVANDDAGAPGTEIEALVQNGRCPGDTSLQPVNQSSDSPHSVFFSANMKSCYGYMSAIGADTVAQFAVPWWWRTDFTPGLQAGQVATLIVNGVLGSANVWVNGHEVATSSTVTGADTRYTFDITGLVQSGTNSLAIEVNPNNPATMFTLDDVDWNQIPPDNNTGIVNWAKTLGQPQAVMTQYANLQSLRTLPTSSVSATAATTRQAGRVAVRSRPIRRRSALTATAGAERQAEG